MITVSLPSIRPAALRRCLDNLEKTTRGEIEVLVCAPYKEPWGISHGSVVWIDETPEKGSSAAHAVSLPHATGELLVVSSDDNEYLDGWDEKLYADFMTREALMKQTHQGPFSMGVRQCGHVGTCFGIYYPYYPCIRPADAKVLGPLFEPVYRYGWGDCDFGLRVKEAGGLCEWSNEQLLIILPEVNPSGVAVINPEADNIDAIYKVDQQRFIDRWKDTYGKGWKIDGSMREFNIDVPLPGGEVRTLPV